MPARAAAAASMILILALPSSVRAECKVGEFCGSVFAARTGAAIASSIVGSIVAAKIAQMSEKQVPRGRTTAIALASGLGLGAVGLLSAGLDSTCWETSSPLGAATGVVGGAVVTDAFSPDAPTAPAVAAPLTASFAWHF